MKAMTEEHKQKIKKAMLDRWKGKAMTEEHKQKIKEAMLDRWKAKKDEQPQDKREIGRVTSVSVLLTAQDRKVRQFIHDMNRLTDKEMNAKYGSYWTKIADFLGLL